MPLGSFMQSLNCASGKSSSRKKSKLNRTASFSKINESNNKVNKTNSTTDNTNSINQSTINLPDNRISEHYNYDDDSNFWDVGKYKIALKRCDNGQKLASELADMIGERAKLEDSYGKSLQSWHNKWVNHLNNESSEYETTKDAWTSFLEAGNRTAVIHLDLSKKIVSNPVLKIKDWLKKNYEKHIINYKKTKEFDKLFEEAQSSWVSLNDKMKKAKNNYNEAIQITKESQEAAKSAETNPKYSQEQRSKFNQKVERSKDEQERAREKFKESIIEMDLYRPRYIENMTEAFSKTQHFEQERMLFFKQIFLECHDLLQIQSDERFDELFAELLDKLNRVNPQSDLDWWSHNFGIGTIPNWPEYEEFDD